MAVVRAHVTALGGNAMVSFYMSELTLVDNPHKNQVCAMKTFKKQLNLLYTHLYSFYRASHWFALAVTWYLCLIFQELKTHTEDTQTDEPRAIHHFVKQKSILMRLCSIHVSFLTPMASLILAIFNCFVTTKNFIKILVVDK